MKRVFGIVHGLRLWRNNALLCKRGGAAARCASLLALFSLSNAVMIGCSKPPLLDTGKHSVDIDALLTLHPAWQQVQSLDRTLSQFSRRVPLTGRVTPDLPPLPTTFAPPQAIPGNLTQLRLQHAQQNAEQYVRQLAETLRLRDEGFITREEKREARKLQTQYEQETSALIAKIRAERLQQAAVIDRDITRLRLRDIAFQSQIRVYRDQALQDAQLQHNRLLEQINALSQEGDALTSPTAIAAVAQAQMTPRLQELQAQSTQRLDALRKSLADKRANRVRQEQEKLLAKSDVPPPADAMPLPTQAPNETPLNLPPPGIQSPAAIQATEAGVSGTISREQATWQAERSQLVTMIRADTQQAVAQIARQRGWKLVAPGTSQAQDETDTVRPLLRAQWQQGK